MYDKTPRAIFGSVKMTENYNSFVFMMLFGKNKQFIIILAQILLKYTIKLLGNLGHLGTKKDIYKQIFVSHPTAKGNQLSICF